MSKDNNKSQLALAMAKTSIISRKKYTPNGMRLVQKRNLALFQAINRGDKRLDSFESCSRLLFPPISQIRQHIGYNLESGEGFIGHPPITICQASSRSVVVSKCLKHAACLIFQEDLDNDFSICCV